jgi:hypothetical protein
MQIASPALYALAAPRQTPTLLTLVYESPSWILKNPSTLTEKSPSGTGEDDFAILAITGSANGKPLPLPIPLCHCRRTRRIVGERVAIGAYAAQYLGSSSEIAHDLFPTLVFDPIIGPLHIRHEYRGCRFCFWHGRGAGGIIRRRRHGRQRRTYRDHHDEHYQGDVSEHTLNAITPLHMRASFSKDTQSDLDTYLAARDIPP